MVQEFLKAAANNDFDTIRRGIRDGIDPYTHRGRALWLSCKNGATETVAFLLSHPIAKERPIFKGCFRIAAINGHTEILDMLFLKASGETWNPDIGTGYALRGAALKNKENATRLLLAQGKPTPEEINKTLLSAVHENITATALLLIPETTGAETKWEALTLAAGHGNNEIITALLDHGADIHGGQPPITRYAARKARHETLTLLIAKGAKCDKKCVIQALGNTPNHTKAIQIILRQLTGEELAELQTPTTSLTGAIRAELGWRLAARLKAQPPLEI